MTASDSSQRTSGMQLAPAPRRRLAEEVANTLMTELEREQPAPGTRMPSERELMQVLEVGRSTVREALKALEVLGLIDIRHGQGAFIADRSRVRPEIDMSEALIKGVTADLLEARRPVELEVARLAPQRRTRSDLSDLSAVLVEHRRLLKAGEPVGHPASRFHLRLAHSAHNEVLDGFVRTMMPLFEERGPTLEALPGYRDWEYDDHYGIYRAVKDRDVGRAGELMAAHLDEVARFHTQFAADPE